MNIPQELIDAFKSNRAGLFVGAGLSQAAGLPSWEGLLMDLIELVRANQYNNNSDYIDELTNLARDSSKYLIVAQELKDSLQDDFRKYIMKKYDEECPPPPEIHKKLIRLPYKFIITTNYDTLLEDAFVEVYAKQAKVRTFRESADVSYDLWGNRQFILKAHGDASSPQQGIILTERDYRDIIFNMLGYQSILQTLFSTKTILFTGSSLVDPELKLLLSFVHNAFHGGGPKHYALINSAEMNNVEADNWRKNFNIQILPYSPDNNHSELEQFIDELTAVVV
jgi:hypothetical protein